MVRNQTQSRQVLGSCGDVCLWVDGEAPGHHLPICPVALGLLASTTSGAFGGQGTGSGQIVILVALRKSPVFTPLCGQRHHYDESAEWRRGGPVHAGISFLRTPGQRDHSVCPLCGKRVLASAPCADLSPSVRAAKSIAALGLGPAAFG